MAGEKERRRREREGVGEVLGASRKNVDVAFTRCLRVGRGRVPGEVNFGVLLLLLPLQLLLLLQQLLLLMPPPPPLPNACLPDNPRLLQ